MIGNVKSLENNPFASLENKLIQSFGALLRRFKLSLGLDFVDLTPQLVNKLLIIVTFEWKW